MLSRMPWIVLSLAAVTSVACGSHEAPLTPDAQALWDRCQPPIARYCRDRSEGSYNIEHECLRDGRSRYAALGDEAGRRTLLGTLGCQLEAAPSSGGTR